MDELVKELKAQGVLKSPPVEAAFRAIDRKDFVPPEYGREAYADHPLPIGSGQTISQPYTVAFMLDLLDPQPGEKILDVGAGSGWQTTLLAHIVSQTDKIDQDDQSALGLDKNASQRLHRAKRFIERSDLSASSPGGMVVAVERVPALCELARKNIAKYNFVQKGVVKLICADATATLKAHGVFDKIIAAAASAGDIPRAWRDELKIGGRIVAPVNDAIKLFIKKSKRQWEEKEFTGFAFVPLVAGREPGQNKDSQPRKERPQRLIIFGLIAIAVILALGYPGFGPIRLVSPVEIEIAQGAGSRAIGGQLKSAGLVRSKWSFIIYAAVTGRADKLKPGIYQFAGEVSVPELTRELASGRLANERLVIIPEGWDLRDIGAYFEETGVLKAEEWWKITGHPAVDYRRRPSSIPAELSGKFKFLADNPAGAGLEGFLFPDTYRVFRNASPEEVGAKMLENFESKITPELYAEMRRQKKMLFEIVTMASLIEKEIPDPQERRITAGILWARLERGMPLQVDAAINYVTGKHESPSAEDLKINSPYNAYRFRGLPLGPIANPGIDAIRAAVYPEATDFSYYLSTPQGQTIFSRTLEEHNAAKAKFLRRRD